MRLITYRQGRTTAAALLLGDIVVDLQAILEPTGPGWEPTITCLDELLTRYPLQDVAAGVAAYLLDRQDPRWPQKSSSVKPLAEVELLSPVLHPSKVIGVGMNYRSFVAQIGAAIPAHPEVFHKTSSALTGHQQPVVIPPVTDQAVPEGELAIIIGQRAVAVSPAQARSRIAGYTVANDISARNLEFRATQWTSGKMLPTFCPLGPALVTADEISDVSDLEVRTLLNGTVIQAGSTSGMILGVDELVSELSHLVALEVGDVILTGTPSDLGALDPPVFLTAGDTIRVEVAGVGALENPVVAHHLTRRPTAPSHL